MFSKLILAAAVAIPLGVLGLSGSAMAAHSAMSRTPIARLHSEDWPTCSAYDNWNGLMPDCGDPGDRVVTHLQHDNNMHAHNSNTNAHSGHNGGHTGHR
jgi:hypothetical protein